MDPQLAGRPVASRGNHEAQRVQVEDPPGDGHARRSGLRGQRDHRLRPDGGRRHPAPRGDPRVERDPGHAARDLRHRGGSGLGGDLHQRRRRSPVPPRRSGHLGDLRRHEPGRGPGPPASGGPGRPAKPPVTRRFSRKARADADLALGLTPTGGPGAESRLGRQWLAVSRAFGYRKHRHGC